MPSSLLFAGLVATWLAVLVPMAARRRQPMTRPSDAALSCRVLERPRRRKQEVSTMDDARTGHNRNGSEAPKSSSHQELRNEHSHRDTQRSSDGPDHREGPEHRERHDSRELSDSRERHGSRERPDESEHYDSREHLERKSPRERYDGSEYGGSDREDQDRRHEPRNWRPPSIRYRPGRGGYDPVAAALAARARYTFRQRMVFALVLIAVASALLAIGMKLPEVWWIHAGADLCLVSYLVYLRRQVRMEQAIRARRAARMAGTRRPPFANDPSLDEWARRGRAATQPLTVADAVAAREAAQQAAADEQSSATGEHKAGETESEDEDDEAGNERRTTGGSVAEDSTDVGAYQPGLPRIRPVAPPERPRGTVVLELDDEDPELHELDSWMHKGYRRAAGQ